MVVQVTKDKTIARFKIVMKNLKSDENQSSLFKSQQQREVIKKQFQKTVHGSLLEQANLTP